MDDRNGIVQLWQYAACGAMGGCMVVAMIFGKDVQEAKGKVPVKWTRVGWLLAQLFRVLSGAGLAFVFAHSGQVSGSLGAVTVGAAAPLIIDRLSKFVPPGTGE